MSIATSKWARWFPAIAVGLVVLLVGLSIFGLMKLFSGEDSKPKKSVQVITVLPPPPPPPPPKEEPPPPEEEEVELEEEEPEPEEVPEEVASDEPPPGELLGLDADGAAGADAFGLIAKKGGRGLLSGGGPFAWYKGVVQSDIQQALSEHEDLRTESYSVSLLLWLSIDGEIERVEIKNSSGDDDRDRALELAILSMRYLSKGPPLEMPQPVTFEIVSRL